MEKVQKQIYKRPVDIDYENDREGDIKTKENKEVRSRIVLKFVLPLVVLILVIVYFGSLLTPQPDSERKPPPDNIQSTQKPLTAIPSIAQKTDSSPPISSMSPKYVDAIKQKSVGNDSNLEWSAESFMRVLEKPGLQSSKSQVISPEEADNAFKRRVQGDAYLSTLSSDGSGLSVNARRLDQDAITTIRDLSITNEKKITSKEPVFVTVKRGDTLSLIAKRLLGSSFKYGQLFEANQDTLIDPNVIIEGQRIRVPQQK